MPFGFLEVVRPIKWVKPAVEEELRPLALSDDKASLAETLPVLCKYQIYIMSSKMRKGLDDTIRRDNRFVFEHERFNALGCHDMRSQRQRRIHD